MQPPPPQPSTEELLEAMEGDVDVDASDVGGLQEEWGPSAAGEAASAAQHGAAGVQQACGKLALLHLLASRAAAVSLGGGSTPLGTTAPAR